MPLRRFISTSIFLFLALGFLSADNALAKPPQINPEITKIILAGVESTENTDLIEQIKKDLKIEDMFVKVIIGSYDAAGITGQLVKALPGGYFILIDSNLYEKITPAERKALIGHEMGYILYAPKIHLYDLDRTGLDICADFFAVKYAGVDAVLSLLEKKLYSIPEDHRDQPAYKIRKAVLEEVRRN